MNNKFSHLGDIFKFTFRQQAKGKGFVIMTYIVPVIFFVVFLTINVLLAVFNQNDNIDYVCKNVYVIDQTEGSAVTQVLEGMLAESENFKNVKISASTEKDAKEACKSIGENDKTSLVVTVSYDKEKNVINITEIVPEWSDITKDEYEELLRNIEGSMTAFKIVTSGIEPGIVAYLKSGVNTEVREAGENSEDMGITLVKMLVPMLGILIVYMVLMIYGQGTGKVVAIEKNSKLMEYMLTLIHPYALITGKVLAISLMSIMQILLWVFGGTAGYIIGELAGKSIAPDYTNVISSFIKMFADQTANAFSPIALVMAVIAIFAGFIFFGFIAGLFGSFVGRPEELASCMGVYNLVVVAGFFGAYFACMSENVMVKNIMSIIPVTSAFSLSSQLAIGSLDMMIGVIGLIVLVLSCILMAVICGKVYKAKIFYKGKGMPSFLKFVR